MWLYGHGAEADRLAGYESCGTGPGVPECPSFDYMGAFDIGAAVIAWTPFAVAAYAGGVLVARDLENGTAALSWTQSVSPARWLTVRLAAASAVVLAGTLLLTTAIRWVWTSYDKSLVNPWYMSDVFHATGVVSLAYTVLAVAVGALAGLLAKRTLPAMGLAFGGFLPVYVAADMCRTHLRPTTHLSGLKASQVPEDADQISLGLITDDGRRINNLDCFDSETSADWSGASTTREAGTYSLRSIPPRTTGRSSSWRRASSSPWQPSSSGWPSDCSASALPPDQGWTALPAAGYNRDDNEMSEVDCNVIEHP